MPTTNYFTHRSTTVALAALTLAALQAAPSTAQRAPLPQNGYSAQSLQAVLNPLAGKRTVSARRAVHGYGSLPLSFEANTGQAAAPVKFVSRGSGYALSLLPTEAVFKLRRPSAVRSSILRMQLSGAGPKSIRGEAILPGKTNYLIGSSRKSWHTDIPTYQKVRYEGVYPGVDLVYYGNQRQLEYDFIVAPKADPGKIKLKFEGAKSLTVDRVGDLVVAMPGGSVKWHKPVIYQEIASARKAVAGRYLLKGRNQVAFALGRYDARRPLVIDPVFAYSTYLGGSDQDTATGIALDKDGNAYLCGTTLSDDLLGTTDPPGGHAFSGFVAKFDPTGTHLIYSTYIGSAIGNAITVDSAGRAYVVGSLSGNTLPVVRGAQTQSGGLADTFLMEINPSGSDLVYSTYLGGSQTENGTGVALGPDGTVVVAGYTNSTNFPTVNPYQSANGGGYDTFIARIDTRLSGSTSLRYSSYLGGNGNETAGGAAVDSAGRIYVAGGTKSTNFPTLSAYQSSLNGQGPNAYLTSLAADGSTLLYSTYLGGSSGFDVANAVAVDNLKNAYITGETASDNFPLRNPVQSTRGGGLDVFIAEIDCNAGGDVSLVYSTFLGGDASRGKAIAVDVWGNAYVTGDTFENGVRRVFVAKINEGGGNLLFGTAFGGSRGDQGQAIAVDPLGYAMVAGTATSEDFPVTPGAVQTQLANPFGNADAFVFRMPTFTKLDFNGDAIPDLLFQNTVTGQLSFWLLEGNQRFDSGFLNPSNPGVNWKVAGTADLNGDGNTDLVLQDTNTGDLIYWLLSGTNQTAVRYFTPRNPGTNWNVVGVADINRDGYADIVFQNSVSGDIYVWYMQGTTQIGGAYINPKNPGTGWKVAAVGDLNADGQADLVFQNSTTGNVYVWYMHSDTRIGGGFLAPANPGAGWNVAGLIDFNGDGKPQIIFQNANSGQVAYWIMTGLSLDYFDLPKPSNPGATWKLVGAK